MNLYEVKIRNKTTGEWKSHGLFRNERMAHNRAFEQMQRLAIHNMSSIRYVKGSIRGNGKAKFDEFVKEIKNFEYTIESRIVR
tara:strand:- start:548 stop:796 length:249 start_codon:yes stop_codon:yes gene_type:complete